MACPAEAFEKTDKAAGCQEGKASTKAAARSSQGNTGGQPRKAGDRAEVGGDARTWGPTGHTR